MDMTLSSTADAIFAAGLVIPVAISTMEYMARPSWHKAATFLALILVLLGYASSLFLSLHFEDHSAYMVAFATSTFGACWLVIASIMNLHRLQLRLQILEQSTLRVFGINPSGIVAILGLAQTAAVACFMLGCVYLAIVHNGSPINSIADAMSRVDSEGRSSSSMFAGYVIATAVLVIFAVALLGLLRYVPSSKASQPAALSHEQPRDTQMKQLARTTYYYLGATILSVLIRTSYHLIEFYMSEPEGLEVAATSALGFYLDLVPVFCACWAVLGQSTALNAADELAESRQSGWPGNEKQSSTC